MGKWATSSGQQILLADPSPTITKFLQVPLEREGYRVMVAHDGIEALKLAFSHHPNLILCDLMMPRMDGYTFMHALKAGFADFIGKPAMPIRVIVRVKQALARESTKDRAVVPTDPPSGDKTGTPLRSTRLFGDLSWRWHR